MKKVWIGLLIAAAGTGVYFFIKSRQQTDKPIVSGHQEWLIGKWTGQSVDQVPDSLSSVQQWEFKQDGIAIFSKEKPLTNDTLQYVWKDSTSLGIKSATDSTATVFRVIQQAADSLILESSDSSRILLGRTK